MNGISGWRNIGLSNATRPAALGAQINDLDILVESPEAGEGETDVVYPHFDGYYKSKM